MSARATAPRIKKRAAPATARRPAARVRPPARTKPPGWAGQIGRAMAAIPWPRAALRASRNWLLGLLLAGGLVAGVTAMGLPQAAWLAAAHGLGAMGFVVRNVQIEGRDKVDRDAVYRIVMDARGQDMPLVDLTGIRKSLLGLGWVEDARVSRRLPDTLVIDLVERRPAAVWQFRRQLALVDAAGQTIGPVDASVAPGDLPLLIGDGANARAQDYARLVAGQPSLKPLIVGGTWIGGRRWDLRFQSGETLALPEGDAAAGALAAFARRDSQVRLLGRGIVRFDMRDPSRMVVRMSREPGGRIDAPDPGHNI